MEIKHNFDFDPTCGFTEQDLLKITPPDYEPADYADFWEQTYNENMSIGPDLSMREIWSPDKGIKIWEVFYKSWDGYKIGAWIVHPEKSKGAIVNGHGYGSNVWFGTGWAEQGFTAMFPCIRGFGLSSCSSIPWEVKKHVLHKIESKNDYVLRGAVCDLWSAASVLLKLFPALKNNLNYAGGSFGGGLGAMCLAWDKRFRTGFLEVPTFANNPVRLKYKSTGSAEAQRLYLAEHPDMLDVLKYYDSALAAKRIEIPVLAAVALFDPSVVPPGQFAVANALKNLHEKIILPAGHFSFDGIEESRKSIFEKELSLFTLN